MDSETRILGDGEFPPELDRVNWSAYFWGSLWALVYGVWPWFWGMTALGFASFVLTVNLLRRTPPGSVASLLIVIAWVLLGRGVDAVLGLKANRLLWERRGWATSKATPINVGRFAQTQRTWGWVGLALLVPGWAYGGMRDGAFTASDWASVVIGSFVLAALWVLDTVRRPAKLTSASS